MKLRINKNKSEYNWYFVVKEVIVKKCLNLDLILVILYVENR